MQFHYSNGNEKCEYFNWGMTARVTCPGACKAKCECVYKCYAANAEAQYVDVRNNHAENFMLWKENPTEFERQLDNALYRYEEWCDRKEEQAFARPSQSGDMPDKRYAEMLMRVFDNHPDVMFFFFTKNYVLPDWDFIKELPFWEIDNCNLMLSEWGHVKPDDELHLYYNIAKAIDIYDVTETERWGYKHCNGKCRECDICKSRYGGDCYFIIHGTKAHFPIPEGMKVKAKADVNSAGFHKFGGKTINGLNLNYCKANGINTYDGRVRQIKEIWQAMERGDIVVYSNGYVVK